MIGPGQLRNRMETGGDLPNRKTVTPGELADEWGVHVNTVYRDLNKGALPFLRLPSGRIRIRRDVADRYGRPEE